MATATTALPYAVPKNVPKWVQGFGEHLRASGVMDPRVADMSSTWTTYQTSHWEAFQQRGKKPKPKGEKGTAEKAKRPKAKPRLTKEVREKLRQLSRIAESMASREMSKVVEDLQDLLTESAE